MATLGAFRELDKLTIRGDEAPDEDDTRGVYVRRKA